MIRFDIIIIFPDIFQSYFSESIIKRAQQKKLVKINIHNLRDFTNDIHKTVDDRPYGGGPGMILKVEPICKAVQFLRNKELRIKNKKQKHKNKKTKVILFSVKGKKFNQQMAQSFSKFNQLILICGRYEGVDERVARHIADMEVSVGDYVLTGGELAAMVLIDVVSRHIPDVLGKLESLEEKRLGPGVPVYTRPEVFTYKKRKYRAPKVLLSGHHKKIEDWRKKHIKSIENPS